MKHFFSFDTLTCMFSRSGITDILRFPCVTYFLLTLLTDGYRLQAQRTCVGSLISLQSFLLRPYRTFLFCWTGPVQQDTATKIFVIPGHPHSRARLFFSLPNRNTPAEQNRQTRQPTFFFHQITGTEPSYFSLSKKKSGIVACGEKKSQAGALYILPYSPRSKVQFAEVSK